MKQTLQLRQSQHLALTPQLQQSIKLLQLSTLELNQEIEQLLIENPMLERMDDALDDSIRLLPDGGIISNANSSIDKADVSNTENSLPDSSRNEAQNLNLSDNFSNWSFDDVSRSSKSQDDEKFQPQLKNQEITLNEHLNQELSITTNNSRDRALVSLLIDSLDENGYLTESLDEIYQKLPEELIEELKIEIEEFSFALKLLQSFEPSGVGARNASECLSIQLKRMEKVPFVTRRMSILIVEKYLELFAKKEFSKLKKILNCDDEDLREAQELIQKCNPHPGAAYGSSTSDYVIPDVIVKQIKGIWKADLNTDVMPKLRVNAMYASILKQNKGGNTLSSQLQEANFYVKQIKQRFDTILKVSQAIVDRQQNFFFHGAVAMKPLVLREIADTLELHESTISRVTSQKFMITPHGMFELKYFFGSHVATESGGEASSTAIRELIKQLIGAEDKKKPFSDNKIKEMLAEQGMVVARRTVAKYRDTLRIPSVNLRKSL